MGRRKPTPSRPPRRKNFAAAALRARLRAVVKQRERGIDSGSRRA